MIEDMRVRNFVAGNQRDYIRVVKKLAAFLRRSPDTATAEELRAFQQHLAAGLANPPSINITVSALRFFFRVTVDLSATAGRRATEVGGRARPPSCSVGRGCLPRPRLRMASSQRRTSQPRSDEGHECDRALPHGRAHCSYLSL
jgi:hypothetical protein